MYCVGSLDFSHRCHHVLVFVFWLLVGNTYDLEVPYKHLYFRTEIQEREREYKTWMGYMACRIV